MTYYVTHVKYDENDDVIEKVRLSDGSVFTKKQMIEIILNVIILEICQDFKS